MIFYIYKITNIVTSKVYIGQTTNLKVRWYNHKYYSMRGSNGSPKLYRSIRKHGIDNFTFEFILSGFGEEWVNEMEPKFILKYDSIDNGYNVTSGGSSNPMFHEDVRKKHDLIMKSPEISEKISLKNSGKNNGMFGKNHTEFSKNLISINQKGRKDSDETKLKKSVSRKGDLNPKSIWEYTLIDSIGNEYKTYCLIEFCKLFPELKVFNVYKMFFRGKNTYRNWIITRKLRIDCEDSK